MAQVIDILAAYYDRHVPMTGPSQGTQGSPPEQLLNHDMHIGRLFSSGTARPENNVLGER